MRILYTVIFVAIIATLITVNINHKDDVDLNQTGVPLCNFQIEPCRYMAEWGAVELTSSVKKITSEEMFDFYLEFKNGQNIEIKNAFLQGRDMYMGKIPLFFSSQNSRLVAQTLIGSCTEAEMVWRMTIVAVIHQQAHTLHFDFISYQ